MAVSQISNTPTYKSGPQPKEYKNTMDMDSFLNILVTQLRNQNPLQPEDDKEFISQTAQFSALEQAQNSNKTVKTNAAYSLISKSVVATHKDKTTNLSSEIDGIVKSAKVKSDEIYLTLETIKDNQITDVDVLYDEISEITDTVNTIDQVSLLNQNLKLTSAYNMIGKTVKAQHYDSSTKKNIEVAGTAEKFRISSGKIYISVSGTEVGVEEVYEVQ